jgi:hypothetical protein
MRLEVAEPRYIACVFYLSSKQPYPTDIQVMVTGKTIGMHEETTTL